MAVSPFRSSLYRSATSLVILLAGALNLSESGIAQSSKKDKPQRSPRAIALLQLSPNGKSRLFPIAILENGKFFDAGAYKAKPVPMALEPQTVYEGVLGGVSQGLFTVTGAGQMNNAWFAEGTWLPTGAEAPRTGKKAEMPVIKDDRDAPPTLKRSGPDAKPPEKAPEKKEEKPLPPPEMKPVIPPDPAEAKPAPEPSATQDPNRPTLRRGLPEPKPAAASTPSSKSTPAAAHTKTEKANAPRSLVAISDAAGPEFRPYNFGAKPDEIEKYLKLMLDLAAQDVRKRVQDSSTAQPAPGAKPATKKASAPKGPRPKFSDIDFRVFDLSNANEPVWILTAKAQFPAANAAPDAPAAAEYYVTLVCRTDIYGDLRKLLTQITDARHLDVISRLELIDAVDADGDGRGELLFREFSANNARGYVLYRFTGDTLWKLFDSFGGE